MPIYEYRCLACKRRVSVFFRSFSAADSGAGGAVCPQCGSSHLQRLVSKVSFIRRDNLGDSPPTDPVAGGLGDESEYGGGEDGMDGLDDMMPGLDEEDPRSVARWARQMQQQTGEDLGPEFNTALTRIESGEDPDRVMDDLEPPAGGADDDLDAALERLDLRLEGASAVDALHPQAAGLTGDLEVAGDLDAQLTRGDDDERLRGAVAAFGLALDVLHHRDAEPQRLAGAGAGLTDEVVAGQRDGEGELLDGKGALDADVEQGLHDLGLDVELAERGALR